MKTKAITYGIAEMIVIIRKNDFLNQLQPEDEQDLNVVHHFIQARKDENIYFDAHCYNRLFFIKEGFIKIGNTDDEGNEIIKDILKPGDVFGQVSLGKDNLYGEFARAHRCDVSLCSFTVDDFEKLLRERPELTIHFFKKIGEKNRRIESHIHNLLHKDVRTRLLHFFWTHIEPGARDGAVRLTMENYLTHEDIARLTATSRQTVTTMINQFAQEGILDFCRTSITIHNVPLLQKLAKVG